MGVNRALRIIDFDPARRAGSESTLGPQGDALA